MVETVRCLRKRQRSSKTVEKFTRAEVEINEFYCKISNLNFTLEACTWTWWTQLLIVGR